MRPTLVKSVRWETSDTENVDCEFSCAPTSPTTLMSDIMREPKDDPDHETVKPCGKLMIASKGPALVIEPFSCVPRREKRVDC